MKNHYVVQASFVATLIAFAIVAACDASAQQTIVLLDDHFDDGDVTTGGPNAINGGFGRRTNGNNPSSYSESGTIATVSARGTNTNAGLVSINSFDPVTTKNFTVTWDIPGFTNPNGGNGMNLTVQSANDFYVDAEPFVRFQFEGDGTNTFNMRVNDGTNSAILATDPITIGQATGGFKFTASFDETGWEYSAESLDTLASNSGVWTGPIDFDTLFDSTTHVGGFIQRGNAGVDRDLNFDRITVTTQIPEPGSLAIWSLLGIGMAVLGYKRLKRKA